MNLRFAEALSNRVNSEIDYIPGAFCEIEESGLMNDYQLHVGLKPVKHIQERSLSFTLDDGIVELNLQSILKAIQSA